MAYATVVNTATGKRKRVLVDDPNAFSGGFQLEKAPAAATPRARSLFEGPDFGSSELESRLADATAKYRAKYLESFALPDVVRQEAEERTPAIKLTRSGLEGKYTGPQYADPTSGSYIDPDTRRALVDQEFGGNREYLSRITDEVGRIYDRDVESSRSAIDDIDKQLARSRALLDEDRQRKNALADYEKQKQIDRRYSTSGGGGGGIGDLTDLQILGLQESNPLGLAQLMGYKRELAPNGGKGYWFYKTNPDGTKTPVKVDEVANAIGGNRAALLEGSSNPWDQKAILESKGKPTLPAAAQKDINSINDALNVLKQIESNSKRINTKSGLSARFGDPLFRAQGFVGANPDVRRFQSNQGYLSRVVRAMGEVGALNEGDIERASKLIPQLGDTKEEAENKIRDLRSILNKNLQQRQGAAGADLNLQDIIDTGV